MISKEVTQERLKTFRNLNSSIEQVARLGKLSANLSIIGQILIQAGPEWEKLQKDHKRSESRKYSIEQIIRNLNQKNRLSLFNALFPGIAAYVEAAWELFDIFPYQSGYQRRPFRNPKQFSLEARISWLQQLPHAVGGYEHQDVVWFAAWAPRLGFWGLDTLGYLFAAAIQGGGKTGYEVFNILVSSANGSNEIGVMGRHVVRGLLCSSRQEGWEYIEKLLLAAQREEGLRQVILEAIDEAHPQAFRRILRVVVDNNLVRFSAVVRACAVWLGLPLDVANQKIVNNILVQILRYLESTPDREKAIHCNDAQDAYYALWAMAFDDVSVALPHAMLMSHSPGVDMRFAAVHFLSQTKLQEALPELLRVLDDDDLRIPARVLMSLNRWDYDETLLAKSDLFERLERLLPRIKHKENNLKPIVWDWMPISLERETVVEKLIDCIGNRSPKRLFQYVDIMSVRGRDRVARVLKEIKQKDREILHMLLSFTGDASPSVREEAFMGLNGVALEEMDIIMLEDLLSRQAQDLRRGVIQLLLGLDDKRLFESINRLSAHKMGKQRLAALELLRECKQNSRNLRQVRILTLTYQQRDVLSADEARLLKEASAESVEKHSLDDALGLMNPQNRTKPIPMKSGPFSKVKLVSPVAIACLKSLDTLVEEHSNDVIEIEKGDTKITELLGNINLRWGRSVNPYISHIPDFSGFPLKDIPEKWWQTRSGGLKDVDGYELIRALALTFLNDQFQYSFNRHGSGIPTKIQKHFDVPIDFKLNYRHIVGSIVEWLIWAHPVEHETDFILDALEESVGRIQHSELTGLEETHQGLRVRTLKYDKLAYLYIARWQRKLRLDSWKDQHHARLWNVVRWLDEPEPGLSGEYAALDDALFAYQVGAATRDDLFHMFLSPQTQHRYVTGVHLLYQFSGRKVYARFEPQLEQFPIINEIVDACRERILDVECKRGELPTAATAPANSIRSVPGMRNLFRLLVALGDSGFDRGYGFGRRSDRSRVLSHLIRNSYPVEGDQMDDFAEQVRIDQISEKTLIDLAVYAPQWVDFIQYAISWDHLNDVVWWLYAHTKDRQWTADEMRDEWAARISERTPLTAGELMDGAVDVAWFRKIYDEIGEERWRKLYDAALYASGGIGHTRARLFADAMLGRITVEKEIERIRKKRNQDSVRALGLISLGAAKNQKNEVLSRYEVMQEFLRTGKKFGSQRKASEKLAVSIGMQNLARTAGYTDPQRLEWAMEVEAIADLSSGVIKVQVDEFQIALSINDLGEPVLEFQKKDKPIKTIPSGIKKNERVAELLERKQKLDRQVSRMRLSLEQAMCRKDEFTISELKTFFRHPILKVMIEQLIFISANGLGYPIRAGKALFNLDGKEVPLTNADLVRIAHPLDLLESKEWHLWQHECFVAERIQPFKQVFRELYVLTSTEKEEGNLSRRYAGHQINPRQAVALFGSRGWVADPSEGVRKTFHDEGISARVGFLYDLHTPAEMEGSTLEAVAFTKRGEWKPLKLEEISPLIFSEVMRDLDLVVSVAHAGGVDPESSSSSIEARAALIRETSTLLGLTNIQISERHVVIDGKLSNYNVNLGSGVVHKQPGGALCIIPVHSQHRGKIFLPFVDNDPKTAEIVSKVIMLARDEQIKDPTILEQIL